MYNYYYYCDNYSLNYVLVVYLFCDFKIPFKFLILIQVFNLSKC